MPCFTEGLDFIRLTHRTGPMPFLLRLWWKLTLPAHAYQTKWRDEQIVNDLRDLCGFFGLSLLKTSLWVNHININYNPTRATDYVDAQLCEAGRATDTARRRIHLYHALRLAEDVSERAVDALKCTPEWHDFNDWLQDL